MFHLEILGSRFKVLLHDLSKGRYEKFCVVRLNQDSASHTPKIHALSGRRFAFLPAGICMYAVRNTEQIPKGRKYLLTLS